jgi:protein-tyrosine kinase
MSNLYEALTRGRESFPDVGLETLLEKEPPGPDAAAAQPAPPERSFEEAIAEAVPPRDYLDPVLRPGEDFWTGVRTVPLRVRPSAPILPFDGTNRRAGEEYRMLRTKLVQHVRKPQMIVVSSAGPGDGKTVTAINLSGALALKTGGRVLLLDGDFRRSRVCTELGLPPTPGLADVLKGDCSPGAAMIQAQQIPNLYILPAGESQVNPTELLDSARWGELCQMLRTHFAHIVMDSPPVGAVADYDLLQAACDAVIVVVRPDHSNRQMCLKVIQSIPKDKMMGVMLNGLKGWLLDSARNPYGGYHYYDSDKPGLP